MKFLLKIVALPEGGGSEISAKIAEKWPKIFSRLPAVNLLLKISKVRKNEFLQFLQEFPTPPPSGRAKNFRRNFVFWVVRPQIFLKIGKKFGTSTPFSWLFRKAFFSNFP